MSDRPRVSAIITNYNHGEFLYEAVAGLKQQTRPADEIIIVDDGSCDHSREVLELLQKELPEIIVIFHERNAGVNAAVKTALANATGDYLITLGADDPLTPQFFEKAMAVHAANPGIGICSGEHQISYPSCNLTYPITIDLATNPQAFSAAEMMAIYRRRVQLSVATAPAIWRRTAWENVGGMQPELAWLSDWFAALVTISRHGFGYVPGIMQSRRHHVTSYSSSGMKENDSYVQLLTRLLDKLETPVFVDVQTFFKIPSVLSRFGFKILYTLTQQKRFHKYLSVDLLMAAIQSEGVPFTSDATPLRKLNTDRLAEITRTILSAYADSLTQLATQMRSRGRFSAAIDVCIKARDAFPPKTTAASMLEDMHQRLQQNEAAIRQQKANITLPAPALQSA